MRKILAAGAIGLMMASCTLAHQVTLTNNPVGSKTGEAKGWSFSKDLDITAEKACQNGGITKIGTMEFKATSFIFVMKYSTTITGE